MRGLRKGGGGGVAGLPPNETTREGTGKALDMERHGYGGLEEGGKPQTYRIDFPGGGGKGVSSGRVSGESRDTYGYAGSLLEEARAEHSHHLGGGKSPPSKMHKL